MIVDPDFPDHWKTRMLVDMLDGDESAPVYLLRLWAHCQNRRNHTFENLPQAALKALCRFPGHANKFESSLAASGFVRREDTVLIVIGWEEYNASLIANWTNGKLGGRPKKELVENPPPPGGKPMGYPSVTHGEPIREDRIGEDKNKDPLTPKGGTDEGEKKKSPKPLEILPEGWKKLSKTEQGRKKVNFNDLTMIRIGKFLGQRETTLWTIAEYVALQDVNPSDDDLDLIGQHYSFEIENNGYRYKDIYTLLNNWPKARTRAEAYFQEFPDHRAA